MVLPKLGLCRVVRSAFLSATPPSGEKWMDETNKTALLEPVDTQKCMCVCVFVNCAHFSVERKHIVNSSRAFMVVCPSLWQGEISSFDFMSTSHSC